MQSLNVLQNNMLRLIVGWRRWEGEDWPDTMRQLRDRIVHAMHMFPIENGAKYYVAANLDLRAGHQK
eukprot:3547943-Pyramimonas_sp.AAC.1